LPSAYIHGWKRAIQVTGLGAQSGAGDNSTKWSENLIGSGSPFFANRYKYFFLTRDSANSKVYIDEKFADMPAQMYAGGLVDMHQEVNISGVVYTPGQLELEQKKQVLNNIPGLPGWVLDTGAPGGQTSANRNAIQYINGLIITGAGVFMKAAGDSTAKTVIAYDDTSIDNLPTKKESFRMWRRHWQELK
ncbi:MAG: hypothetical protein R8K22_03585, partial [Mariprofundaceae bacterium]